MVRPRLDRMFRDSTSAGRSVVSAWSIPITRSTVSGRMGPVAGSVVAKVPVLLDSVMDAPVGGAPSSRWVLTVQCYGRGGRDRARVSARPAPYGSVGVRAG